MNTIKWQPLGELDCVEILRSARHAETSTEGKIPVLSFRELKDHSEPRTYLAGEPLTPLAPGDLFVALTDPMLGKVVLNNRNDDFAVDQTVATIRCTTSDLDPLFLYHWLRGPSFANEIERLGQGSIFRRVSRRDLESIRIPVPDQELQDRYVREFGQIENSLKAHRESITVLDSLDEVELGLLVAELSKGRK